MSVGIDRGPEAEKLVASFISTSDDVMGVVMNINSGRPSVLVKLIGIDLGPEVGEPVAKSISTC
jgi:hypothetical protein